MTFNPATNPVDYILLAGKRSRGSRPVFRGLGISKFSVAFKLFSSQDWDDWVEWSPIVQQPPVAERPRAIDIWHPMLEDLQIKSVVVESVLQPDQVGDGEWDIIVRFIEHRRPVRILEPVDGSQAEPLTGIDLETQQAINDLRRRENITTALTAERDALVRGL